VSNATGRLDPACTLPASLRLRNDWGTVYGGVLALMAKSAGAAAVQCTADPGTGFTALDIKVNLLRAVPADGRELRATGTMLHRGKRLAIANAEVPHGDDRVAVLTGTTAPVPPACRRPTRATNTSDSANCDPAAATDTSAAPFPTRAFRRGVLGPPPSPPPPPPPPPTPPPPTRGNE
jgi:uncharacterized protein (TIGR00369 family)